MTNANTFGRCAWCGNMTDSAGCLTIACASKLQPPPPRPAPMPDETTREEAIKARLWSQLEAMAQAVKQGDGDEWEFADWIRDQTGFDFAAALRATPAPAREGEAVAIAEFIECDAVVESLADIVDDVNPRDTHTKDIEDARIYCRWMAAKVRNYFATHPAPAREGEAVCVIEDDAGRVGGCGRPIIASEVFRCLDCGRPFHRDCLRHHCSTSDEKDREVFHARGTIAELRRTLDRLATHPAPASGGTVTEAEVGPWLLKAADRLAGEVCRLTDARTLGTRTPAADALLDYATARHGQSDPIGKIRAALAERTP